MYKVLIVDDEEFVRDAIANHIEWQALKFSQVFQAQNGIEGLEIAISVKPDLVFADIRMPIMDGLEFAAQLKEYLPSTHIIIFSGYDDFKYAQEAIKLGVSDYLLKPLGSAMLTEKVRQISIKLDEEAQRLNDLAQVYAKLRKSSPMLKEDILRTLICLSNHKSVLGSAKYIALPEDGTQMLVCVIEINMLNDLLSDEMLYFFAAKNIASETIGTDELVFTDYSGHIVVLLERHEKTQDLPMREYACAMMSIVQANLFAYIGITSTIAIGITVEQLDKLSNSYTSAMMSLDYKYTHGKRCIYDAENVSFSRCAFVFPLELSKSFCEAVKAQITSQIELTLKGICDFLKSGQSVSSTNIKIVFIELVTSLIKLFCRFEIQSEDIISEGMELYKRSDKLCSIDDIFDAVYPYALRIARELTNLRVSHFASAHAPMGKQFIMQVMEYLNSHYDECELSLLAVAEHFSLSAGYLSSVFKRESGITFSDYLSNMRMEKAKELLLCSDNKSYEVAYQTGYANPHYFSIAFKKHTGFSPSDYRKRFAEQPNGEPQ